MKIHVFLVAVTGILGANHADGMSTAPLPLVIRQIDHLPAACIPVSDTKSMTLKFAGVWEDSHGQSEFPSQWGIEWVPGAKPLLLRAGQCVVFGQAIDGYRLVGDMHPLKAGRTYNFSLRELNKANDWSGMRYSGMFCVQENTDGTLSYLPYVTHKDGTVTYPACGRYIGSPPAADGIVPPGMP